MSRNLDKFFPKIAIGFSLIEKVKIRSCRHSNSYFLNQPIDEIEIDSNLAELKDFIVPIQVVTRIPMTLDR